MKSIGVFFSLFKPNLENKGCKPTQKGKEASDVEYKLWVEIYEICDTKNQYMIKFHCLLVIIRMNTINSYQS